MLKLSVAPLALLLSRPLVAQAATWKIDRSHSVAAFKVRHLMVTNVNGTISGLQGTVDLDETDLTKSKVVATLDAATINTGDQKRDDHLRSPDFLNIAKNPLIKFESKSIAKDGDKLKLTGALTLNGVTKDVVLDVEAPTAAVKSPMGDNRRGLSATTKINRKDFGITWNKSLDGGGVLVGEDVGIQLDLQLTDNTKPSH
jgi:polyisoprenoid-binding protein YceI